MRIINEGKALAFAFIVYDLENHTIPKILKDRYFWCALDRISDKQLSIFYIDSRDEYYKKRQEEIYQEQQKRMSLNAQENAVPITQEQTPTDLAINHLREVFKIEESINTPFVIFFQINNNDISDSFIVKLKKDRLEDAFFELRDHIRRAVDPFKKNLSENHYNHQEIFNLIKAEVKRGRFSVFIKNEIDKNLNIGTIMSFLEFFIR